MQKAEDQRDSWIKQEYRTVAEAVLDSDRIESPMDKLVALDLATRFPHIYPSVDTIAERCCLSRSTVFAALKSLVRLDVIEIEKRYRGNGSTTSSRYRFVDVSIPSYRKRSSDGGGGVRETDQGGASSGPPGVQEADPLGVQEADPQSLKSRRSNLRVVDRARATSPSARTRRTRETPPRVFVSLKGWHCTEALRAEWLAVAKLPCSSAEALRILEARISELRVKRIGGASGVTDRAAYVRNHFETWARWGAENLEKAQRRAAFGPSSSDRSPARSVATPPPRSAALKGFPPWVSEQHLGRLRSLGQEGQLRALVRDFRKQHHIPPDNLDTSIAAQSFDHFLRRRVRAAA
jgi:hypothetical protein